MQHLYTFASYFPLEFGTRLLNLTILQYRVKFQDKIRPHLLLIAIGIGALAHKAG